MQHDVAGNFKVIALMIAGTVYEQQDELAGILLGQCLQENLEALRVGRRHDQIDTGAILRADGAIQIDVFANELAGDLRPRPIGSPAQSRAVHAAKARFVGEHDAQAATPSGSNPPGLLHSIWKAVFFKSFLSRDVALGMKWTRHQLAPAVPSQKIVDRAVAGRMPDRLFIGRLEIVDIQHLARPGGLGKTRQQSLLPGKRHVLALAAADRLRLERLDPAVVIGHVGAVHGAQRNSHRRRDRRLRHPALAQQYHLDALTLCRWEFPPQRRLQFPYLAFAAFDHRFPRISGQSESHRLPNAWHPVTVKLVDSTRYGSGISCTEQFRVMAFAQLTYRESLRDIEVCLAAQAGKLYHMGIGAAVARSTLADTTRPRMLRLRPSHRAIR